MSQAYSDINKYLVTEANSRGKGYIHFEQIRLKKNPTGYPGRGV